MLQLPHEKASDAGAIKKGLLRGLPNVKPFNCPVLALAAKYEQAQVKLNTMESCGQHKDKSYARMSKRLQQIAEQASHLLPASFEGATFQIALASNQLDAVLDGPTDKIRTEASNRSARLLKSALSRIATAGDPRELFPLTFAGQIADRVK